MVRYGVVMGVCLGLVGCRETLPPVPKPVYRALTQEDVTATAKKLAELRGLPLRERPKVLLLDRAGYEASIDETRDRKRPVPGEADALPALLGLLGPTASRKPQASEAEEAKEHVAGFYEHADKTIRMPNKTPESWGEDASQRALLAHELHHAMQFQSFRAPERLGADESSAWRALVEGDASATEIVHTADSQYLSVSGALRRARYDVAKPQPVSPLASPVGSSDWESLPQASETLRNFPYREGLAFVVDLYRAGGFALVDQAYARPPKTTEQILHPQKYLSDEQPRAIANIEPPAGWKAASVYSLGELRTRVFLEPCLGNARSAEVAAGWHGDRAFVLSNERSFMLAWVSAWDTEPDAVAFEDALARMGPCLPPSDAAGKSVGAGLSIRRSGSVVAFARGGEHADRSTALERLLTLPGDAPAAVPVSTAQVPPLRQPPEPAGGAIENEMYRNDFLGLSAPTAAFDAEVWSPRGSQIGLLWVKARRLRAGGGLLWSTQRATPEAIDRLFTEWEEQVVTWFAKEGYETTRYQDQRVVQTGLGVGYERSWTQRRGVLVHRVTIVPICGGTGHITLQSKYSTVPGRELMDYWVQSFSWLDLKKRAPVCEHLDPDAESKAR
jgi:hypothetical protein